MPAAHSVHTTGGFCLTANPTSKDVRVAKDVFIVVTSRDALGTSAADASVGETELPHWRSLSSHPKWRPARQHEPRAPGPRTRSRLPSARIPRCRFSLDLTETGVDGDLGRLQANSCRHCPGGRREETTGSTRRAATRSEAERAGAAGCSERGRRACLRGDEVGDDEHVRVRPARGQRVGLEQDCGGRLACGDAEEKPSARDV
eukprot:6052333-Pleurochrysis_carterae.AAC.3